MENKFHTLPDWAIRTVKTFIQVFLGTLFSALLPALATPPASWGEVLGWFFALFTPQLIIGDCFAAAICAVWNYLIEINGGR